jgi:hypothetical protein
MHHAERVEAKLLEHGCTDIRWIASQGAVEWVFTIPIGWNHSNKLALAQAILKMTYITLNTQTLVKRAELLCVPNGENDEPSNN